MYIYILSYRVTHTYTHIYIYFKPHNPSTQPSQQQQPAAAAAAAAAAAGCCYTFQEMEEMQASANVPIRDIYIYIRFIISNGIYKIGGKYSHHIFELYTRFIIFRLVVKYIHHICEIYTRFIIPVCSKYMCNRIIIGSKIDSSYT